jgi:hypothetical protein
MDNVETINALILKLSDGDKELLKQVKKSLNYSQTTEYKQEYKKEWYQKNKHWYADKMRQHGIEYRANKNAPNNKPYTCECGTTIKSKRSINQHKRTKKHHILLAASKIANPNE